MTARGGKAKLAEAGLVSKPCMREQEQILATRDTSTNQGQWSMHVKVSTAIEMIVKMEYSVDS